MAIKGEQTRAAILDRAIRLSSTVGLESLSLAVLAREVGLSKSGLFAHFRSKEDLQLQLIERARARFVERVVAPALKRPRGEPRFRTMFEKWLEWDSGPDLPGGCVFMTFAHELDDRPGPPRDALVATLREWVETLKTAARLAIAEGHFRANVDVDELVFEAYGIVLAYNHFHRTLGIERAERRARRAFDALIDRARR
ncbi:MAG TPA: TetR/AcrR family transcriptional regulator [Candidatus Polarisedimenticolaceae bacterium]|nr:TetR/AcrR family transcriptional regulator [Candidatus Polarisedimenticolaceae bacterium]